MIVLIYEWNFLPNSAGAAQENKWNQINFNLFDWFCFIGVWWMKRVWLFGSFGGLRAACRHWLRRKEDKQQHKLSIPIKQSKERERSWFAEWEEPMELNFFDLLKKWSELARQWKQINKWSTKQQQLRGKPKTANQQFLFFRVELWAQEEKRVALLAAVVGAELNY